MIFITADGAELPYYEPWNHVEQHTYLDRDNGEQILYQSVYRNPFTKSITKIFTSKITFISDFYLSTLYVLLMRYQ